MVSVRQNVNVISGCRVNMFVLPVHIFIVLQVLVIHLIVITKQAIWCT